MFNMQTVFLLKKWVSLQLKQNHVQKISLETGHLLDGLKVEK